MRCPPVLLVAILLLCYGPDPRRFVYCLLLRLQCAAAMLAVEDSHVRELFRRHCYTNFTTLIGRSMCVSDEHYLASLMASYGLDNTTDCKVRPNDQAVAACSQLLCRLLRQPNWYFYFCNV
jgi:hypothetical protein